MLSASGLHTVDVMRLTSLARKSPELFLIPNHLKSTEHLMLTFILDQQGILGVSQDDATEYSLVVSHWWPSTVFHIHAHYSCIEQYNGCLMCSTGAG